MPSSPHALNDVISVETLAAFADAWNRHDVDALMTFMTDDCVFETANGPDAFGTRHVGMAAVRTAFESAWKNFPDAQWRDGRHFVAGDRGISEWLFTGTAADGTPVVLEIDRTRCHDGMSGEAFEAAATLTVGDRSYQGCGAFLFE